MPAMPSATSQTAGSWEHPSRRRGILNIQPQLGGTHKTRVLTTYFPICNARAWRRTKRHALTTAAPRTHALLSIIETPKSNHTFAFLDFSTDPAARLGSGAIDAPMCVIPIDPQSAPPNAPVAQAPRLLGRCASCANRACADAVEPPSRMWEGACPAVVRWGSGLGTLGATSDGYGVACRRQRPSDARSYATKSKIMRDLVLSDRFPGSQRFEDRSRVIHGHNHGVVRTANLVRIINPVSSLEAAGELVRKPKTAASC
ncbi:hypothetical protein BU23DRAFT_564648 [Bimuria novae-zelandiae CBS 107.79]|uniref:Uncharacterized protein n=1 Tax=Bimuria novae-zelandiae CBS 107.79 TaxID=1447943 RepID=A0A6A5VKN8_9PLEO|nr:hypothetical protein BU23DRAFT_564648 [Bimuria novae-zelandiae CBS 107.79]